MDHKSDEEFRNDKLRKQVVVDAEIYLPDPLEGKTFFLSCLWEAPGFHFSTKFSLAADNFLIQEHMCFTYH